MSVYLLSKNSAKSTIRALISFCLSTATPISSFASQRESKNSGSDVSHSLESVFLPMENIESKTLWLIESYKLQGKHMLLSLAAIQARDPLGLSVVVLDPPPNDILNEALKSLTLAEQGMSSQSIDLPVKDIPDRNSKKNRFTTPRVRLQLRATAVNLADIATAQMEVVQQITGCGPNKRRAVAFIRPEAIEKHFNIGSDRAREWSQYGRAACVDWNTLPDPDIKSSDRTVFQPL